MPDVPSLTHHPSPVTHHSGERTLEGSHHVLLDLGRHLRPASLPAAAAAAKGGTSTTERRASCLTAAKAAAAAATKGRAAKGRSTAFTFAFTATAFTFALAFATAFAPTASSTAEDRTTTTAASTTEDRTTTTASSTTEDRTTLPTAAKDGHARERVGLEQGDAAPRACASRGEALQRTTSNKKTPMRAQQIQKIHLHTQMPHTAARPRTFTLKSSATFLFADSRIRDHLSLTL